MKLYTIQDSDFPKGLVFTMDDWIYYEIFTATVMYTFESWNSDQISSCEKILI